MRFWVQNYLFCTVRLAKPQAGEGFVFEVGAKVGEFCNLHAIFRNKTPLNWEAGLQKPE